jgi:putative ABC transport system substrate-binding protein
MLRRLLLGIVALAILTAPVSSTASQIVAVVSGQLEPFDEALQGFRQALEASVAHRGPRAVQSFTLHTISLSDHDESSALAQHVRGLSPDLVLAVGSPALERLRDLSGTPVVYLLVHTRPAWLKERTNITGVEMEIPPARWFDAIRGAFPDRVRIGLLYDPTRMGDFVQRAKAAARESGFTLIAREVLAPREVYDQLLGLEGKVDALWMLPDLGVVTPQTVGSMFLFSIRQRVPVITFSERYLVAGATVALLLDFSALGEQAGAMALQLLDGRRPGDIPPESPAKLTVRVNQAVAERLGVLFRLPKAGGAP